MFGGNAKDMNPELPKEYTDRMKGQLLSSFDDYMNCFLMPSYKALRINRRKVMPVDHASVGRLATGSEKLEPVDGIEGAFYYDEGSPGKSALHAAGAFYIQEPSAMLPATLMDIGKTPLKVLDLCAAPGGKTTQIADMMNGLGLLVANEIIPSRAKILSENIERMGVENALVISEDPEKLSERFAGYFDRILVDAPCSGEGMFRKNPEAVSEWSPENVEMCAKRQDWLLDCAVSMLAPGGKIVYSTCTFSPEEDEECVERFLARHPSFAISSPPVKLYPHTFRGEGHFAVSFIETRGTVPLSQKIETKGRFLSLKKLRQRNRPSVSEFAKDFITETDRLAMFGDSLYLVPDMCPDIDGLKVLRAGVKIGTYKKDRLEPDHALSHVLRPEDANCHIDLEAGSREAMQYLEGMTINCAPSLKGWCLVCAGGLPMGWGKASGGVVKNHYPKGLRSNAGI